MKYTIAEWAFAAYFIFVAALLPFAVVGGTLYLAHQVWGPE